MICALACFRCPSPTFCCLKIDGDIGPLELSWQKNSLPGFISLVALQPPTISRQPAQSCNDFAANVRIVRVFARSVQTPESNTGLWPSIRLYLLSKNLKPPSTTLQSYRDRNSAHPPPSLNPPEPPETLSRPCCYTLTLTTSPSPLVCAPTNVPRRVCYHRIFMSLFSHTSCSQFPLSINSPFRRDPFSPEHCHVGISLSYSRLLRFPPRNPSCHPATSPVYSHLMSF